MTNAIFYYEWLGADKNQFRVLALLAPIGDYSGNLSDMCRSLNIDAQTRNRNKLRQGISELTAQGYITSSLNGRTYILKVIPTKTVIEIPVEWLHRIMQHNYSSENVSWQAVLKVLLWIIKNNEPIVTRSEIAADTNIGVDTITSALKVLENDFYAITKEFVSIQMSNGEYRRVGLEVTPTAWWK